MCTDITDLRLIGVTEKKGTQFRRKGIENIRDLLCFFPRTYREYAYASSMREGSICFVFRLMDVRSGMGKVPYLMAKGLCNGQKVSVFWFGQVYRLQEISGYIGQDVLVAGKVSYDAEWEQYSVSAPDVFHPATSQPSGIVVPVYSKISGMGEDYLASCIKKAVSGYLGALPAYLPLPLEKELGLTGYQEAVCRLHYPRALNEAVQARKRVQMEDLYYFAYMMWKEGRKNDESVPFTAKKCRMVNEIIQGLPYDFTEGQKEALDSMMQNAKSGHAIHAMVQGDVGCGKSIVAFLMAALIAENGRQTAILAPTSVLAKQHYNDLSALLSPYGIAVAYIPPLTSIKKKERTELLESINTGEASILVGTHSLLNDQIKFQNLGLVITDEEHKFGVEQRSALLERTGHGVHYITMSATPIPRSLADVIYGEATQLYQIRTMPAGRKPVNTAVSSSFASCFKFFHKQIDAGRQIYIVCPQIDASDAAEGVASVKDLYKTYCAEFGEGNVAALTGKNTKKETAEILENFKSNKISILIATTVIEVGVNVPNASTICIHNAERFGLASLHQLRGRVGRGGGDAYCILFSTDKGNQRLAAMCETSNGFEIAEKDLEQRGGGDLFGLEQSGGNKYIDLVLQYPEEYKVIRDYLERTAVK